MKKMLHIGFLSFMPLFLVGQVKNIAIIRNYSYTLCVDINDKKAEFHYYDTYGVKNSTTEIIPYSFQAQEYSNQLGLYFFPERSYSAIEKRFYQPDPASQYFSPFSFAGGDPVNLIDLDGAVAKPIVLYQYEHRAPIPKIESRVSEDLRGWVPDAHYVSLADFTDGNYTIPSDWNGSVFIEANTSETGEIFSERFPKEVKLKTSRSSTAKVLQPTPDERMVALKHSKLGKSISRLSRKTGVPISSVTFSGSQGDIAAQMLGDEIVKSSKKMGLKQVFETNGLKKGYYGNFLSVQLAKDKALVTGEPMKLCETMPPHFFVGKSDNMTDFRFDDRGRTFNIYDGSTDEKLDVIRGGEFEEMMSGRVPYPTSKFFEPRLFELK